MQKRYAVIDIGSNNVLLLIAEKTSSCEKVLYRESRISHLTKGMKNGVLTSVGIAQASDIIKGYLELAMKYESIPLLIATSAAREAVNFDELQRAVGEFTDQRIGVISGRQEALYNGYAHLYEYADEAVLLFDIGGGSTEFAVIENREVTQAVSVNLGIRRLSNKFGRNAWQKRDYIREKLDTIDLRIGEVKAFVGIGGTATSLAAIGMGLKDYDEALVHGYSISREKLDELFSLIYEMPATEVPLLIPFNPISRELLLTGLNIIREIIAYFNAESFFVSDRTWQYGVLMELSQESLRNDRNI